MTHTPQRKETTKEDQDLLISCRSPGKPKIKEREIHLYFYFRFLVYQLGFGLFRSESDLRMEEKNVFSLRS